MNATNVARQNLTMEEIVVVEGAMEATGAVATEAVAVAGIAVTAEVEDMEEEDTEAEEEAATRWEGRTEGTEETVRTKDAPGRHSKPGDRKSVV